MYDALCEQVVRTAVPTASYSAYSIEILHKYCVIKKICRVFCKHSVKRRWPSLSSQVALYLPV
jgi:ferredoxin-like protein FixX